jgi:hypothetical protein
MSIASESMIREGLSKAALYPDGLDIHSSKGSLGLFLSNKNGKAACIQCLNEGWIQNLDDSSKAKITDEGWSRLRKDPRLDLVLSDWLRLLDTWKDQERAILQRVKENIARLDHLSEALNRLLSSEDSQIDLPIEMHMKHLSENGMDVPLPQLWESIRIHYPRLTLGEFHDSLRRLRTENRIHLHAWTGPLQEIPCPDVALMAGHDIAYYASLPGSGFVLQEQLP